MGAAIAAGSQALKGIWALLVEKAKVIRIINNVGLIKDSSHIKIIVQWDCEDRITIESRIRTSPSRFVIKVIIPAPKDLLF